MPTARELLEQADALMRRNRASALDDIPVLTDSVPMAGDRVPLPRAPEVPGRAMPAPPDVPQAPAAPAPAGIPTLTERAAASGHLEAPDSMLQEGEPSDWLEFEGAEPSVIGEAPDSVAIVPPVERLRVDDETQLMAVEHEEIELTTPAEEAFDDEFGSRESPDEVASEPPEETPDAGVPVAARVPEPVAFAEPEPVAVAEPEPVAVAEPEPVAVAAPEPVAVAAPEPVAVAEPGPVAVAEPEPVVVAEPEPVAVAEPEPVVVAEPEPVAAAEPPPVTWEEHAPIAATVSAPPPLARSPEGETAPAGIVDDRAAALPMPEPVVATAAPVLSAAVASPAAESPGAGGAVPAPSHPVIAEPEPAAPAPAASAGEEQAKWDAIAEEVRVQVLQRIDLFTDAGLRDQLGLRLKPIADRASADLVATINVHVGELLRAYVAEAIEREIESWRRNH